MTAPVVQALRAHYRDKAKIDFITLAKFKGAAELISAIDTIYTVEKSTAEISSDLQKNGYDYLIDLHSNVRSRSLARALNIITFKVNKLGAARLSLVLGMRKKPVEHFIERSLNLLSPFSISQPTSNPWGTINCTAPSTTLPSNYIVLAPGAAHHGKELPESTLEAICTKVDSHFVIVGGPDMQPLGSSLASKFPKKLTSLCGLSTLSETAFAMRNASLAIGGDTELASTLPAADLAAAAAASRAAEAAKEAKDKAKVKAAQKTATATQRRNDATHESGSALDGRIDLDRR